MSTAIDLFVLTDEEVSILSSTMDIEAIDQDLVTLWQFTNFELEEIADWWGVQSSGPDPICFDEASGIVAFEWSPEFVRKIAGLDPGEFNAVVERFQQCEGLLGINPDIVSDNIRKMQSACGRALSEGRRIVQVDSM